MRYYLCIMAVFFAGAGMLCGATYHVAPAPAGSDANDGASWLAPMATISNALAQVDVNLVLVSNGLYEISSTITNAKAATVRGVNSPGQTNTIIDGGGVHGCFLLDHATAMLDGLLITNGYTITGGGGVRISSGGGIVTNCLITGNRAAGSGASYGGGGIWMYGTGAVYNSRIIGNRIVADTTPYPRGGGIFMNSGPNSSYTVGGLAHNCLIAENVCTNSLNYGGGGIFINRLGTVSDSVISNNTAAFGGGVTMSGGGVVTNCWVVDNISLDGAGGIYMRDADTTNALVTDCVISNNRTGGSGSGGGLYLSAQAVQTVRGCTITHNWSINRDGGGMAVIAGAGRVLIDGCTIEYNRSSGLGNVGGGGVHVTRSGVVPDDVQIVNSAIRYNQAAKNGGGIALYRGGVVSNCLIEGNIGSTNGSYSGGGVYLWGGGVVAYSRIVSNTCQYRGGGMFANEGGCVINSLVAGNISVDAGGGLYAAQMVISNGSVQSCTFVDNESGLAGGGIYVQSTNYFVNTIVYSNRVSMAEDNDVAIYPFQNPTAATNSFHYCCTSRDLSSANQHNITNAPRFTDWAQKNFRLAAGSPGLNAGSNEIWMATGFDLDGRPRLDRFSGIVDIGCYEHISGVTMFCVY